MGTRVKTVQRQDVNKSSILLAESRADVKICQNRRSHLDSLTPSVAIRENIIFNPKSTAGEQLKDRKHSRVLLRRSKNSV